MRIYLAGAISGCSYEEAANWRKVTAAYFQQFPNPNGIPTYTVLDPMGDKDELSKEQAIRVTPLNGLFTADKAIVSRDKYSVLSSDIVLANLSYGANPLIGTCYELGWADMANIPVIAVFEEGSRADHPFTRVLTHRVDNLIQAFRVIETYK